MDIPYGHRNKIIKRINANQSRPVTKNIYEELPEGIGTEGENIKDEDIFDEEEQRRLFQEAVEAFRKGNKPVDDNYDLFSNEVYL